MSKNENHTKYGALEDVHNKLQLGPTGSIPLPANELDGGAFNT